MAKKIIQKHHIIYKTKSQEEVVEKIYKGEHWIITQLKRRKNLSKGFIKALKHWLLLNEEKAVEL